MKLLNAYISRCQFYTNYADIQIYIMTGLSDLGQDKDKSWDVSFIMSNKKVNNLNVSCLHSCCVSKTFYIKFHTH